ncbi:hypothetical protein BLNAU_15251 [Blattamonas nauphoetae]|uniref:U-box domain-containing protein n=1 Tax=Blattamonas nauphoetae TaxID=2049346 RepID=A0ABQ9XHU9_9EUKA|nr:hypothetical protein BLNAU_15251 [Blattamonas nauphoetae]
MLSDLGSSSSSVQQSPTSSSNPPSSTPNEWLEKVESLKTESDENKVRQSQEMVNACLEDCGHKKGTVQKLMEARILPILALELRSTESREVRVGFQVLFDTILLVISENGSIPLSKHFPSLLALSKDKDSRIAEPVIETIGLISHNLSSRGEVDEFLRSGILEWLVEAVRTHPDGQVRQAIVVGQGEIGFGLKKAVVREKRGDEGWKKEEKKGEKEGAASGVEGRGRREGRAGRWLLGGSVSRADLLSLESESWVVEDSGAMDLASRCRRGVRMAGQALIGVLRGWETKPADQKWNNKKNEGPREEETVKEREWESDVGVLEAAGSVCGLIFPEVYSERRNEKEDRISVSGEDLEVMKRQLAQASTSASQIKQLQLELEEEKRQRATEAQTIQNERKELEAEKEKLKKEAESLNTLQAQLQELRLTVERERKPQLLPPGPTVDQFLPSPRPPQMWILPNLTQNRPQAQQNQPAQRIKRLTDLELEEHGYLCPLTLKVIQHAAYVGNVKNKWYEKEDIVKFVRQNKMNPETFDICDETDIVDDPEHQKRIDEYFEAYPDQRK